MLKSLMTIPFLFAVNDARNSEAWGRMQHLELVAKASSDAREFRRMYPGAKLCGLPSTYDGPSEYHAKYDQLLLSVGLYERYILTLNVPFERGTTTPEKATFLLLEITRVNGGTEYGYQTSVPAEKHVWDCIRWSGDLRAFGVETLTNSPVDGFEHFWKPK